MMSRRRAARLRGALGLLLVIGGGPALAAAGGAVVTLAEVERHALSNERLRTDVAARLADAEAALTEARGARGPKAALAVEGSVAPGGQLIDIQSGGEEFLVQGARRLGDPGAFTATPRFAAIASAQVTLLDFGRGAHAQQSAERRRQSIEIEVRDLRRRLRAEVRQAYLAWLLAFLQHRLTNQQVAQSEADAGLLEGRIAEGGRPRAELTRARAGTVTLELEAAQAAAAVERSRLTLEQLTGMSIARDARPEEALLEREPPPRVQGLDLEARSLELQAEAASATAARLRLQMRPIVGAGAELGVRAQSDAVFPAYRVGVTLSVPLWEGGVAEAQARAASAEAARLRAQAWASQRVTQNQQAQAGSDWQHADRRVSLAETLRQLAREILQQAEERSALGSADLGVVGDARSRLLAAELQVLLAKGARTEAALRLGEALAED
jgi:outer membrane protein TolC